MRESMLDPLARGHAAADKIMERRKREAEEAKIDEMIEAEEEAKRLLQRKEAEDRQKELDELYKDSDVMTDIFPSWQK